MRKKERDRGRERKKGEIERGTEGERRRGTEGWNEKDERGRRRESKQHKK